VTRQRGVTVTREMVVNDGDRRPGDVERIVGELLQRVGEPPALIVVVRERSPREVAVEVYDEFTPDYTPLSIISGMVRLLVRGGS
jgi:hypothetical protein